MNVDGDGQNLETVVDHNARVLLNSSLEHSVKYPISINESGLYALVFGSKKMKQTYSNMGLIRSAPIYQETWSVHQKRKGYRAIQSD